MTRRSLPAVLAVAIAALALILSPLSAPAIASEEAAPSLDVSVAVTSDDGRFVLGDIELTLFEWVDATEGAGEWAATATELDPTDAEGLASFQVAEVGDFMLGFVDPDGEFKQGFGLGSPTQPAGPGAPGTFSFDGVAGDPVTLDVALVTIVDPEIEDAEVVGLVLDEEGTPIPDVLVEALRAPGEGEEGPQVVDFDHTSEDSQWDANHEPRGGYRLILPPGEYQIRFTSDDDITAFYGGDLPETVVVEAGRHYELEDVVMPALPDRPTAVLTGTAVNAGVEPLIHTWVDLYRARPGQGFRFLDGAPTDSEGRFEFDAAPTGVPLVVCLATRDYRAYVCADGKSGPEGAPTFTIPDDATAFELAEPVVDPSVDVTVPVVGLRGQPLTGLHAYFTGELGWGGGAMTNDAGEAVIRGVLPGDYAACTYVLSRTHCTGGVDNESEADTFTVPGDALSFRAPTFQVPVGGAFTGSVVDASGDPVPGVQVESWRFRAEGSGGSYDWNGSTSTRPDGTYSLLRGTAGEYAVCVHLTGRGDRICANADGLNHFGSVPVEETDGDLVLDPIVTPEPVLVRGIVRRADGTPVQYPYVNFHGQPWEGETWAPYLGYAHGAEDGAYEVLMFPGDSPITACTWLNDEHCLGGTNDPTDPSTEFFMIDGTQNPFTVPDLVVAGGLSPLCNPWGGGGGAVVDNGSLAMGMGCLGQMQAHRPDPDPDHEGDRDYVGLRLEGQPDAVLAGCWCEGWGVADGLTGSSGVSSSQFTRNLSMTSFTGEAGGLTAASTVLAGSYDYDGDRTFSVTHEALPSTDPNAYLVRVSITNLSDATTELRYRRTVDWDVAPTQFDELVTIDTGRLPELAFASNDGFASPDPLSRRDSRGISGNVDDFGPKDQGALLDFNFGDLLAGETKVFTLAMGGAQSKAAAEEVLAGLGAKAYAMATASDPARDTSYFLAYGVDDVGTTQLPTALPDAVSVSQNSSVDIDVLANDSANAEGGLVVIGARGARHGSVMCSTESCTYQHHGDNAAEDSFRYTIRNSTGQTAVGRVTVTIEKAPPAAVVVVNPAITPRSDVVEGDTVQVTPAEYSDAAGPLARSYDWFAVFGDGAYRYLLASGPETSLQLPAWVEGARIVVVETARTPGATPVASESEPTDVVQGVPELVATTWPVFDALPTEGKSVTPEGVAWNEEPDAVTYRWYVNGSILDAADERLSEGGVQFTPSAGDVGSWLYVELVSTKQGYTPGYAYAYASRIKGADDRTRLLRISLTDPEDAPVTEASGWLCSANDCYSLTLRAGAFEAEVSSTRSGLDYQVSVYPYASTLLGTSRTVSVEHGEQAKTVTIGLEGVERTPPSVSFPVDAPTSGDGADAVPMGFIGSPLTPFTATGCTPVENPAWTVAFANGSTPMTGTVAAEDAVANEDDPTKVDYTVRIPELTSSGHATITTNFDCDGPISFTIYIDPSGYVTDQFGRTIAGAEVTLLRSEPGAGNFAPVADGDAAVMDPHVNDHNPSLTDDTGFFRWDVTEGDYRVSVTKAASGGASCAVVTTPTMPVPPVRVDLLIKTECAGATTPTPTTAPAVTGTREVGRVLTVSEGIWSGGIVQTGVQWLRNGQPIDGATGSQYTLVQADAGQQVTARVTARRPHYAQENGTGTVVSFTPFVTAATGGGAVTVPNPGGGGGGGTSAPVITNTAKPTVNGAAKVAGTLVANPGTWSADGLTFVYQWSRGGTPIAGATGAEYSPVLADLDAPISVTVTATKTGATPGTATSDPVTIGKGTAAQNLSKPLVTGTPEVGETLTVSDGTWDSEGLAFAYQWLRDGEPIEGGAAATYVVTEVDLGAELTARVTASKPGHEDGSVVAGGLTVPDDEEPPVDPAASTTKATLLGSKVKQGERGEVRVKVTSEGDAVPTGTVTVTAGGKGVEVTLTEADDGKVKVALPKLKPGKYEVSVSYAGDEATAGSSDEAGTLKVKEKKDKKRKKDKGAKQAAGGRPMPALF